MATGPDTGASSSGVLRKLLLPAAVSVAGGAAGLALTKRKRLQDAVQNKQLRDAIPNLRDTVADLPIPDVRDGVGELTDDLRGKLDAVLGRNGGEDDADGAKAAPKRIDRAKFERRRDARRKRREQRRRTSRS